MTSSKETLGRLPPEAIGRFVLPEFPTTIIPGFKALPDLTALVSDAMDDLGLSGAIPASLLRPTTPSRRMVGRALTVRNIPLDETVEAAVQRGVSRLGEIEAHNLAEPGDVLVLQGVDGVSNMGGLSASIGRRQGEEGAIVDGAVRDVEHSRGIGYPIWSRSVSPVTGKWRIQTVAVNKPVSICGVTVDPGDLVLADEDGVCFIAHGQAGAVLERARQIAANERDRHDEIEWGVPLAKLSSRPPR